PVSLLLGFYAKMEMFQNALYITLGLDFLVLVYSIAKFKHFKNKRIYFTKELQSKTIVVENITQVNQLNPIEFEYFVKQMFVQKGYKAWTTQRTHDNGADVIAELNNERIVIQVKHSKKSIDKSAVIQAVFAKDVTESDKAMLVTNNELTNQAKLYAQKFNIDYLDTNKISSFLRKNQAIKFTYKK
ncbi:MAG: restriction endonuclease, partial [Bacilli bacterium]|nr:restriction endonuclease [Bacilli bacterium]